MPDAVARVRDLVAELVRIAPWWQGWARPITAAEIAAYERAHTIELPADYKAVLLEVGDHAPLPTRPGGAIVPLAEARERTTAREFLGPLADEFGFEGEQPVAVAWDDDADDYADPHWLRGCLPLTGSGCDLSVVLVVSGRDRGRVWLVAPSGSPELHPTKLAFADWYVGELEQALARERLRVHERETLANRVARDPEDNASAIELAEALLFEDRPRARTLLERVQASAPEQPGLARAWLSLELFDATPEGLERVDALADRDPPWGRCLAAIAAVRRSDDARALELFADAEPPALLAPASTLHHALALARTGKLERALERLRTGATSRNARVLAAAIHEQLGEHDRATKLRTAIERSIAEVEVVPHPPNLGDALVDSVEVSPRAWAAAVGEADRRA